MPDVTVQGLDKLTRALEDVGKDAPQMQRRVHEQLGEELQRTVQTKVYTVLTRRTGKVGRWQVKYIGSGGGYAAVRPAEAPAGPNGAGAVTNYIVSGHVKRVSRFWSAKQTRRTRTLRAKASGNWVSGRDFYAASRAEAPRLLERAANTLAEQIANKLR